jgi:hypothetical protein
VGGDKKSCGGLEWAALCSLLKENVDALILQLTTRHLKEKDPLDSADCRSSANVARTLSFGRENRAEQGSPSCDLKLGANCSSVRHVYMCKYAMHVDYTLSASRSLFGWLVLVCSERRVLLADCWWLVCCERKVADKTNEQGVGRQLVWEDK